LLDGPNLGITGNSNRALKACRGDYVAFMGGDDVLLPGKISKQVEWFEKDSKRVLCYHDIEVFDSSDNKTLYQWSDRYRFHSGGAEKIIEYGTFFGATSVMVRVPKAKKIQFDPEIPLASDWFYWIEVVTEQGGLIGSVDGIYARYRRHSGNITRHRLKMLNDRLKVLDLINNQYPQFKSLVLRKRPEVLFNEAARAFLNKDVFFAFKLLGEMFRCCKGHLEWPIRTLLRITLRLKY
jgi:glycosyltransferase involved in cell wall biosynthesis